MKKPTVSQQLNLAPRATSPSAGIMVQQQKAQNVGKLLNAGQLAAAETAARDFIKSYKDAPIGHNLLGAILHRLGQPEYAIKAYRRAIKLKPDFAEAHANLGTVYRHLRRFTEAAASHQRAINVRPDYVPAYYNLANVLGDMDRADDAIATFDKAIELDPKYFQAHYNRGLLLQQLGRLDEAEAGLRRAIDINPGFAEAYRSLARHIKFTADDPTLEAIRSLADQPDLTTADRMHLDLALAKASEDLGDHDAAFTHYVSGNKLRRSTLRYDPAEQRAYFDQLKHEFGATTIDENARPLTRGPVPIFVLGMPRSGTSLVEQILASHPMVTGAGELPFLADLERRHFGISPKRMIDFAALSENKRNKLLVTIARGYFDKLKNRAVDTACFVDKTPSNFRFIPLIKLAFPNAKIIHVVRNAEANCWAVFKNFFASGGYFYSYDLDEMVDYHNSYSQLMANWHNILPDQIFDLQYEGLVENQASVTADLLAACELPWDDGVLDFHTTDRAVKTASATQVRQPIYRSAIEEWKRYEDKLAPHFTNLRSSS